MRDDAHGFVAELMFIAKPCVFMPATPVFIGQPSQSPECHVALAKQAGPVTVIATCIRLVVILIGIAEPYLPSAAAKEIGSGPRRASPSADWLFGTDNPGHSIFAHILKGNRQTFLLSATAVVLAPGAMLTLAILYVNYVGDAARNTIEPASPGPLEQAMTDLNLSFDSFVLEFGAVRALNGVTLDMQVGKSLALWVNPGLANSPLATSALAAIAQRSGPAVLWQTVTLIPAQGRHNVATGRPAHRFPGPQRRICQGGNANLCRLPAP